MVSSRPSPAHPAATQAEEDCPLDSVVSSRRRGSAAPFVRSASILQLPKFQAGPPTRLSHATTHTVPYCGSPPCEAGTHHPRSFTFHPTRSAQQRFVSGHRPHTSRRNANCALWNVPGRFKPTSLAPINAATIILTPYLRPHLFQAERSQPGQHNFWRRLRGPCHPFGFKPVAPSRPTQPG